MINDHWSLNIDHRPLIFNTPQVRRLSAREPRQAPAGSSAKRCRDSLRGAWGISPLGAAARAARLLEPALDRVDRRVQCLILRSAPRIEGCHAGASLGVV